MATTEQLMAQYGVAWFGFDETSGDVYDKLGLNSYSAINTNVDRVEGWNSEGNAVSFNGTSSALSFNFGSNLTGELTFRFKMKTSNSTASYAFATLNAYSTQKGMALQRTADGRLQWAYTFAGNQYAFILLSNIILVNNKWYDVMLSWDGKANSFAKIFINGELDSLVRTVGSLQGSSFNIAMGRLSGQTTGWWRGQIDDLQIYNKALSPSDFEQKRLVVKTTDNKNLVLSPNTARVKEIPNTAEYMMLAQGGVIKEIDSAVDSTPIDFTKTTTEYDIVTNNRTPLGKGRLFTIPIGSDFKTAMIEDNY